ncbi:glycosyltransferase family 4 protein [Polaribacter sp.]|nr:glycosyltransferase family 4 protein [Polaribacter sp.]
MSKNSVLIIGAIWVEPNSSAAGSRMLQLISQFLQQHWNVTFASAAVKGEKAMDLKSIGVDESTIELNQSSFDVFVKQLAPTIVLFDRFMIEEQYGWRVAENCPNALRILDTEDLHCLRKTRHKALKKNTVFSENDLLKEDITKREIASILRCDLSLMISAFEMDLLTNFFKIDEKLLYHLPFLLPKIDQYQIDEWKSFEDRKHFTMIGNFLHAPNVDAVLLLKNTIWKQIRKQLPEAELHIYGAYPTQQISELHHKKSGFLVKGYTPSPKEIVQNIKVVLAPLRFGAGIKGKLTEAMVFGAPSVTTSIGAEGMHEDLPWNGSVTDDFEDFAQKAVALYTDNNLWKEAQENGVAIVNTIFDKEIIGPLWIHKIIEIQKNLAAHRDANFLGRMLQHQTMQSTKYMSKWIEAKNRLQ